MGKNRHSKDKLYIVASEYCRDWGGYIKKPEFVPRNILPYYCCNISLLPFSDPVCTRDGIIFDRKHIIDYIEKNNCHPLTGESLDKNDLIGLNFYKNSENKYYCPITLKQFNEHSHIVAISKTGNVFSYDAIDAVCYKSKSWFDLLTQEPISVSDLIVIQNPLDKQKKFIISKPSTRESGQNNLNTKPNSENIPPPAVISEKQPASVVSNPLIENIMKETNETTHKIMQLHNKIISNNVNNIETNINKANTNGTNGISRKKHSLYTTSGTAASFTSTIAPTSYTQEYREVTDDEEYEDLYKRVKKLKKKGYVRLITTLGSLNIELHCDKVPELCYNFILNCTSNYYNDTIFHRSIKNFMIQGGDPTGTGTGGECAILNKTTLKDEFHPHLVHKNGGIVSMANNGKHTNRSQFFITYKSCEHLNNVHSVIGRVVGGMETLHKMEKLDTDSNDRPLDPPKILETKVFQDPFSEVLLAKKKEESLNNNTILSNSIILDPMCDHPKRYSNEIGKYAKFDNILNNKSSSKRSIDCAINDNTQKNENESKKLVLIQQIQEKLKAQKKNTSSL